ncbi:MAG: SDR family NAD(P)-dependent oxidoreductase [Actinobacteria bacterium]|nr:SDR family NAD(P)-dependent oxidoreductase [Actinomycetota bacterium]
MEQLEGKVAVVTGGASGIGRALAERFAAEGMKLVLADVEEGALAATAKELADGGADTRGVVTDVADRGSVDALATRTLEEFGAVHVVCNNAGVGGLGHPTWDGPLSAWEWVLGVNLWGVIHGIRAFVPALVEQDEGHVVNTASMAGLAAMPFMGPYTTTKHAVVGLSEVLFHELGVRGSAVGVSVLCPNFLRTNIFDSDRNWPSRLGESPGRPDEPGAQFIFDAGQALLESSPNPSMLAEATVDAIRGRRFVVLSDSDAAAQAMATRRDVVVDGVAPTLGFG